MMSFEKIRETLSQRRELENTESKAYIKYHELINSDPVESEKAYAEYKTIQAQRTKLLADFFQGINAVRLQNEERLAKLVQTQSDTNNSTSKP